MIKIDSKTDKWKLKLALERIKNWLFMRHLTHLSTIAVAHVVIYNIYFVEKWDERPYVLEVKVI